jgi:hypothetical protein
MSLRSSLNHEVVKRSPACAAAAMTSSSDGTRPYVPCPLSFSCLDRPAASRYQRR